MPVQYENMTVDGCLINYTVSHEPRYSFYMIDDAECERVAQVVVDSHDESASVVYFFEDGGQHGDSVNYFRMIEKSNEEIVRWAVSTHPQNG